MSRIRAFFVRLGGSLRRARAERELNDEIESHLQLHVDDNVRAGMTPAEARRNAVLKLGGIEAVKEAIRDRRRLPWLEHIAQDVRFALRSLRKSKALSLTVVATLGLCIWANTSVLSVLYGLVLKRLPFPDSGQIVAIHNTRPKAAQTNQLAGVPQYLDYKAHADLFADFAIWKGWMFNLSEDSGTSRYVGMRATADFFSVLGLQPLIGRFFTADECVPGRDQVAVLTQSFWETHFQADPAIVGRVVRLSGVSFTIVGVMPRHFEEFSVAPLLLKPYEWQPPQVEDPRWRLEQMANLWARIKPGVDHQAALAQLQTIEDRNREKVADPAVREFLYSGGHRIALAQVRAQQTEPINKAVFLLQGGAMFVLLLGCVNVASLMLARANTRAAEFALRQALGASRWTLSRQLLTEAALLAFCGAALGLALAGASLRIINTYMGDAIYGIPPVRVDATLIGLTLLVSLVVTTLIGLLPIVRLCRGGDLQGLLQKGARSASASGGIRAMSGLLVIVQMALALMLLIGAGLLLRSFANVMAIDPGFAAAKVVHARIAYEESYNEPARLRGLQDRILEKMRAIPGVDAVAYSDRLPGFADTQIVTVPIRGRPAGADGMHPTAALFQVSPEYFRTMGIRLLEGRDFTAADLRPGARPVVIVDRRFAERYFPGRSPLGEVFAVGPAGQKPEEMPMIVGVVEVARVNGLEDKNRAPYVYIALDIPRGGLSVELRTPRAFAEIFPLIRAAVREVDPALPIYQAQVMQEQLDKAAANRRGVMALLGTFAGLALLLSAVGIYGMLAYDVTQRTREIGIRGAIGATRRQIVAMILRQGLWKAGAGLVAGLIAAFFLTRTMSALLFEVQPNDPLIFSVVPALLVIVTLLASGLPARRAAKVDPIVALRCE
jgi:putative ABC transport system permease protein